MVCAKLDSNIQARIQAGALPARAPAKKKKKKERERERERERLLMKHTEQKRLKYSHFCVALDPLGTLAVPRPLAYPRRPH